MNFEGNNLIVGILNVTPDSFSDGGEFQALDQAIGKIYELFRQGADIVDIGAESSRPGSKEISADDEWRRLKAILEFASRNDLGARISIDTGKEEIAIKAANWGVGMINDTSGGLYSDEGLRKLAGCGVTYIGMHKLERSLTMQLQPLLGTDAVDAVEKYYHKILQRLELANFKRSKIWLDPGIGFGKDDEGNLKLIQNSVSGISEQQVMLGVSRKAFIGRLLGIEVPKDRDDATKMLEIGLMCSKKLKAIRTHDVERLAKLKQLLN